MSGAGDLSALSELVQQAEQLTAAVDSAGQLPRVERNLRQLAEAGQQLWSRTAAQTAAQQVRAAVLLGSRGVDVSAVTQRLQALGEALGEGEGGAGVQADGTDVAGFLRAERENAVLAVIERSGRDTWQMVDESHWTSFQQHWQRQKQRLLEDLSAANMTPGELAGDSLQTGLTELSSTVPESAGVGGAGCSLTAMETAYADQVRRLVDSPGGEKHARLMQLCRDALRHMNDPAGDELWAAVAAIADLRVAGGGSAVQRGAMAVQTALVDASLHVLQTEQLQRVRQQVFASLRGARLGGVPSVRQLLQSFLAVRGTPAAAEAPQCDGVSGWALVFHCLRCGDAGAAREAALACRPPLADVARWLGERASSADGAVSASSEPALRLQYRRCCSAGGGACDPHQRLVLAVLGAGAGESPGDALSELTASTADDLLWFRLSCVRAVASPSGQVAALSQLQHQLRVQLGESHFSAYSQPLRYFRVLLLSGQLEAAVDFLARVERLRAHAVHIGLVLQEASLLQLSDSAQAPVFSTAGPVGPGDPDTAAAPVGPGSAAHRINLVRVTLLYTRRFEQQEPAAALYYLAALRRLHALPGDAARQAAVLVRAVADLARASGRLPELLGRVSADGARQPGLVERLQLEEGAARQLVAAECEQRGQLEEAAQLHDLAGNRLRQLQLLCQLLGEVAAQAPAADEASLRRQRLIETAAAAAGRFRQLQLSPDCQHAANTLHVLLDLATFFELAHSGRAAEAVHVVQRLRLVSLASDQLEARLQESARLDREVLRLMPDTLLATMSALHAIATAATTAADPRAAADARQQSSALLTFAGTVPYRLPGDTHARLTRIDALMN